LGGFEIPWGLIPVGGEAATSILVQKACKFGQRERICNSSCSFLQDDIRRFTTKVSDFGLSRLLPDHSPKLGSNAEYTGTITHMAPELLEHGGMSRAADVYSFGVLSTPPPPFPLLQPSLLLRIVELPMLFISWNRSHPTAI
jgi:hypothetical protein